jgi:hypothetical protein
MPVKAPSSKQWIIALNYKALQAPALNISRPFGILTSLLFAERLRTAFCKLKDEVNLPAHAQKLSITK